MAFVKGDPRINRKGNIGKPKVKLQNLWKDALADKGGPLAFFIKLKEENPTKFIDVGLHLLPKEKDKEKDVLPALDKDDLVVAAERVLKHLISKGDVNAVKFVLQTKGGYLISEKVNEDVIVNLVEATKSE